MVDADAEVAVILGLRKFQIAEVCAVEYDSLGVALHPADAKFGAELEVRLGHRAPFGLAQDRRTPRCRDTEGLHW